MEELSAPQQTYPSEAKLTSRICQCGFSCTLEIANFCPLCGSKFPQSGVTVVSGSPHPFCFNCGRGALDADSSRNDRQPAMPSASTSVANSFTKSSTMAMPSSRRKRPALHASQGTNKPFKVPRQSSQKTEQSEATTHQLFKEAISHEHVRQTRKPPVSSRSIFTLRFITRWSNVVIGSKKGLRI